MTRAAKMVKTPETLKSAQAAAVVIESRETGAFRMAGARFTQKILRAWNMKKRFDALKAELDGLKADILKDLETDETVTVRGVCKVVVNVRNTYEVIYPAALQDLLGDRYEDLVRPVTKLELEPKLKEMLLNPADPIGKFAREYVKPKSTVSVSFLNDEGR